MADLADGPALDPDADAAPIEGAEPAEDLDVEEPQDGDETPEEDGEGGDEDGAPEPEGGTETEGRRARGVPDQGQRQGRLNREAKLQRRLDALERQISSGQSQAPRIDPVAAQREYEANETRQLEAARGREMQGEVGAVAQYFFERTNREGQFRQQQLQTQLFEREDKSNFRIACREDQSLANIADWVEDRIAEERAKGNYSLTREVIGEWRLGKLYRERLARGKNKQQRTGAERVARSTTRAPANSGSSAARQSSRNRRPESEWTAEDYEANAGNLPVFGR